jgi:hypothetical protein
MNGVNCTDVCCQGTITIWSCNLFLWQYLFQYEEIQSPYLHTSHRTVTKNGNIVGIYMFILTKFIGQIIPCFYVTWRLISVLTQTSHFPLSLATTNQSISSHPIFLRSSIIFLFQVIFALQDLWLIFCMHFSLFTGMKLFIISL